MTVWVTAPKIENPKFLVSQKFAGVASATRTTTDRAKKGAIVFPRFSIHFTGIYSKRKIIIIIINNSIMTEMLMMPREITLNPFSVKRRRPRNYHGGISVTKSDDCNDDLDDMSSLAYSLGDEGLESGFESFADFLQFSSLTATHDEGGRRRRRRKFASLGRLGTMLKKSARCLQGVMYGLCGIIVFSVVNVAVAVSFLFFLVL
jgi:hypothetical protein